MRCLINELSFVSQFRDIYEVQPYMDQIRLIIKELKPVKNLEIYTHRILQRQELCPGYSVINWLRDSFKKSDRDQDFLLLMIDLLKEEKCISRKLDEEFVNGLYFWECKYNRASCANSSLAGAAYFSGKLISIKKSVDFDAALITVNFTKNMEVPLEVELQNLTDLNDAQCLRPKFVYHSKHDLFGSWKDATSMDLSDEDAQRALDESVMHEGHTQRYSLFGSKYYVFQDDNAGGYHGYPIPRENVPNSVLKFLDS